MKSPWQVHTTGFDVPIPRMISAYRNLGGARQTCFGSALRSETTAPRRRRSSRVTFTTILLSSSQSELLRAVWDRLNELDH